MTPRHPCRSQSGAALLMAMLTVTLVATFAVAALWQQWRATEIESAERARLQSSWVLIGALDWSRLILREDARAATLTNVQADHLAEPWAVPLEEARLSTFLAADKNVASDSLEGLPEAYLSGRIVDGQSKLNVLNLVNGGKPAPAAQAAFTKLFTLLNLPPAELAALTSNLQRALPAPIPSASANAGSGTLGSTTGTAGTASGASSLNTAGATGTAGVAGSASTAASTSDTGVPAPVVDGASGGPLLPQHLSQLTWLGVSPTTIAALEPYVTVLPTRTPLNINTASAEAIFASVPALDLAGAKRIVMQRARGYFKSLSDLANVVPSASSEFTQAEHAVGTRYFEVLGRLRLDSTWVEEHSLLFRDGIDVRIVWRERGAGATPVAARP